MKNIWLGFFIGTTLFLAYKWDECRKQLRGVTSKYDYELQLTLDSIIVWDSDRRVGAVSWENGRVDSLIKLDNN